MRNIEQYVISENEKIISALEKLNTQCGDLPRTLFIENKKRQIVGTITDGDIRRGILKCKSLDVTVSNLMHKEFTYFTDKNYDVSFVRNVKSKGVKVIPILNKKGELVEILDLINTKTFLPIDAVLMAGGKGERLRPMTLEIPKPLLKVGNKPIIDYNIENILENGIENINVTVNYLKEQIEEHFIAPRNNGVHVKCVRESKYLGTIGSIKFVKKWHNDTILIMNSDLFTNIDLEDFYLHFKENNADMSVAAVPYCVSVPYGIFEIKNTRDIVGIKEKPSYHYYANAGIYLIKKEVLDLIPDDEFYNATDLIEALYSSDRSVIRYPLSGYWIDIGNPEDFKKVQDFAKHIK